MTEIRSVFLEIPRHPYYIVTPRYTRTSAGVKVLHLLCHALNRMGEQAYLIIHPYYHPYYATHPDLQTPLLTKRVMRHHFQRGLTPITIYPESVKGNPFNAPFVVRYVLNYAGLLGGDDVVDEREYCISYSKAIADTLPHNRHTIFIPASDPRFFLPGEGGVRSGACYYAGKYKYFHGGKTFPITDGLVEITRDRPDSQTPEQIRDLFRRVEAFYCYENSALAIEAILCGCPVIFLPNDYFTDLIGREEMGGLGYAWGADPAALEHAKRTIVEARERFLVQFARAEREIEPFVKETQVRAAQIPYHHMLRVPQIVDPGRLEIISSLIRTVRLLIQERGIVHTAGVIYRRLASGRIRLRC